MKNGVDKNKFSDKLILEWTRYLAFCNM